MVLDFKVIPVAEEVLEPKNPFFGFFYLPSENKTATFHIEGLSLQEKNEIPVIRAPYDTDVYCVTCNKTQHVKAGDPIPFCCGRLMEILD